MKTPIITEYLIRSVRRKLFFKQIRDSTGVQLGNLEYLIRSYLLARKIRGRGNDNYVGVLLPTSAAAAITALAVFLSDKIPVFINFTASKDAINYALSTCNITRVITSKRFVSAIGYDGPGNLVYLEDWVASVTLVDKIMAFTAALFLPASLARTFFFPKSASSVHNTATIIFSSGSTGTPKGVALSHNNLLTNLDAILSVLDVADNDVMLGALPFFHSFGFIGNFLLPLYVGIPVVYHANPTEAAKIGDLVEEYNGSILFATPTFLQGYIRKCRPEKMRSLRLVVAGAEKLPKSVAERFSEKFGVTPIEGYGCTELSPVVSINVPELAKKIGEACGRTGSVGKPIPGVMVRVVDPVDRKDIGRNREGLITVQGPNVMVGYLGEPEKTAAVINRGWYDTGDMGYIDDDGYLFITGRYSRFSKIAGEMVPHGGVEEAIHRILETAETCVVVTSTTDSTKGEKLVVLHLPLTKSSQEIIEALRRDGLPNLWIPKAKDFYQISEIPLLGSGKLDLGQVRSYVDSVIDHDKQVLKK